MKRFIVIFLVIFFSVSNVHALDKDFHTAVKEANKILEEARNLSDQKMYDEAIEMLEPLIRELETYTKIISRIKLRRRYHPRASRLLVKIKSDAELKQGILDKDFHTAVKEANKILEEARNLSDQKMYDEAIEMLEPLIRELETYTKIISRIKLRRRYHPRASRLLVKIKSDAAKAEKDFRTAKIEANERINEAQKLSQQKKYGQAIQMLGSLSRELESKPKLKLSFGYRVAGLIDSIEAARAKEDFRTANIEANERIEEAHKLSQQKKYVEAIEVLELLNRELESEPKLKLSFESRVTSLIERTRKEQATKAEKDFRTANIEANERIEEAQKLSQQTKYAQAIQILGSLSRELESKPKLKLSFESRVAGLIDSIEAARAKEDFRTAKIEADAKIKEAQQLAQQKKYGEAVHILELLNRELESKPKLKLSFESRVTSLIERRKEQAAKAEQDFRTAKIEADAKIKEAQKLARQKKYGVEYKLYPDQKPLGSLATSEEMCNVLKHPLFQRPLEQFRFFSTMNGYPQWNTTRLASQWLNSRVENFSIRPTRNQWNLFPGIHKIANNRLSMCLEKLSSTSPRTYSILKKKFLQYLKTKPKCFEQSYKFKNVLGDDGKIRKVKILQPHHRSMNCLRLGGYIREWESSTFLAMLTLKEAHPAFKTILDNGEQELSQKLSSYRSAQKAKAKQKKKQTKKKLVAQQRLNRIWQKYQNRNKSLVEEALNYTVTNKRNGGLEAFWVSDKKNPCVLRIYGTDAKAFRNLGYIKKELIDLRKINQTAFVIKPKKKLINNIHKPAWYFVLKSGPIIYFHVPTSFVDGARLGKAWGLAFEKCPGKRSRF